MFVRPSTSVSPPRLLRVKLPVANATPWPAEQRFDFLVRSRELSKDEAQTYRDLFRPAKTGDLSPNQRTAHTTLRVLTGRRDVNSHRHMASGMAEMK